MEKSTKPIPKPPVKLTRRILKNYLKQNYTFK